MSYPPLSKTKPKAYVKNNSTCPNDSTVYYGIIRQTHPSSLD
jgi:hypothetical protein